MDSDNQFAIGKDQSTYLTFSPVEFEGAIRNFSPIKSRFFSQIFVLL